MFLSICIPSYNRFDELRNLLTSIIKAKRQDFNVFVIDNDSKENIFDLKIDDPRIHLIKRDTAVPGAANCRTCLDYGDGMYRMLCLDKDYLFGEYLDHFIECLKNNSNAACGYCELNSKIENGKIRITNNRIENSIYRCVHPSGYFVRSDTVDADRKKIDAYDKNGPFYNNVFISDLLYAQGLILGKEAVYTGRLIQPETPEKARQVKSYTYSASKGNLYFMPYGRTQQFEIFCRHLNLLELSDELQRKIIKKLFMRTLQDCTFVYKNIMENEAICQHHGIECKKISLKDMKTEQKNFSAFFKEMNLNCLSNRQKTGVIYFSTLSMAKGYLKTFLRAVKQIIKQEKG